MTASWLLSLETSVTRATLALARDGAIVAKRSFTSERSQECDLFPPLQSLLAELPEGERLSTVIVGTGPGSYNGARVGIAVAQSVAQTHDCPVAGLCSFEGVEHLLDQPVAWAVGDARRGSFFILPIKAGRAQAPPELLKRTEFRETITTLEGPKVTFEPVERLPEGSEAVESRSTAQGLVKAWLNRSLEEQEELSSGFPEAFYLRPPHITKSRKTPGL